MCQKTAHSVRLPRNRRRNVHYIICLVIECLTCISKENTQALIRTGDRLHVSFVSTIFLSLHHTVFLLYSVLHLFWSRLPHDLYYSEKNWKSTGNHWCGSVMISKHFVSTFITNIDAARVSVFHNMPHTVCHIGAYFASVFTYRIVLFEGHLKTMSINRVHDISSEIWQII